MNILNWLLIEVRSWDVQALSNKRDTLAGQLDRAFAWVRPSIERVLKAVRTNCRSTQDAIDFAREIVRILDQFTNPPTRPESTDQADPEQQQTQGEVESPDTTSSGSGDVDSSVACALALLSDQLRRDMIAQARWNLATP